MSKRARLSRTREQRSGYSATERKASRTSAKGRVITIHHPVEPLPKRNQTKEAQRRARQAERLSVNRGIEQAKAGELHDLGSFEQYTEEGEAIASKEAQQ